MAGAAAWLSLFDRHAPDGYVFPTDTSVPALDINPTHDEGWQGLPRQERQALIENLLHNLLVKVRP